MSKLAEQSKVGAAEFAERFAAGWGAGGPADRFVEHFAPLCTPQVLLIQPLSRPLRGVDGLRRMAEPLFEAMPDLRGEVLRWGPTDDGVMIELGLRGTLDGRPLEWITLDRIVLARRPDGGAPRLLRPDAAAAGDVEPAARGPAPVARMRKEKR